MFVWEAWWWKEPAEYHPSPLHPQTPVYEGAGKQANQN